MVNLKQTEEITHKQKHIYVYKYVDDLVFPKKNWLKDIKPSDFGETILIFTIELQKESCISICQDKNQDRN